MYGESIGAITFDFSDLDFSDLESSKSRLDFKGLYLIS